MGDGNTVINAYANFRNRGWMPGLSGAIALLCDITQNSRKLYITPDQIDKNLTTNDLFLLRSLYEVQDVQQPLNQIDNNLTISKWSSIFLEIFAKRSEVKVIAQITTKWSVLAARMALEAWRKKAEAHPNVVRLAHWELLNNICPTKELLLPVINFAEPEIMLAETKLLLPLYPETCAILVRDYGMVVWGDSLDQIERRVEILEYVCEMQVYSYALLSNTSFV